MPMRPWVERSTASDMDISPGSVVFILRLS
jgi:hypothetical protein